MDLDSLGLPVVGLGLLYARMSENERFSTLVLNVSDSRCLYFRTSKMICTWIAYRWWDKAIDWLTFKLSTLRHVMPSSLVMIFRRHTCAYEVSSI